MFEREHHRRIGSLLSTFDSGLLSQTECLFGGGTAITLSLGEYRESLDVDFLCASREGYRHLRNVVGADLNPLLTAPVKHLREVRMDQYGIRTVVEIDGQPVKVEIVSEGRIALAADPAPPFAVPTLSRVDLYAEKLLANTDRGLDKAVLSRDIIDLAMMIEAWGSIPLEALSKAQAPYGASVLKAFHKAASLVQDDEYLMSCLVKMKMESSTLPRIQHALKAAFAEPEVVGRLRTSVAGAVPLQPIKHPRAS